MGALFEKDREEIKATTDAVQAKAAARAAAFARRDALSAEVRAQKSEQICAAAIQEIAALVEQEMGQVMATCPIENASEKQSRFTLSALSRPLIAAYYEIKTEVSVEPLRRAAWERGWRVALPCVITPGHIEFYEVSQQVVEAGTLPFVVHPARTCSHEQLQAFMQEQGIASDACRQVAPEDIDAIVVPLVAFNPEGGRLGYGGGNYDRYIPRMREDSLKLGIAFAEQRDDSLQLEVHDCRMANVITA